MLIRDYQNTNHLLHKVPTGIRTLYWFPALLIALCCSSILIRVSIFCIFSFLIIYIAKVPIGKLIRLYRIPVLFIVMGCTTLLFTWKSSNPLLEIGSLKLGLDDHSLSFTFLLFFQSMATISIIYFFMLTHTISEIAKLMKALRVPQIFTELYVLSYKFILNLLDTYHQLWISMQCRMAYSSKIQQWKNYSMLIGTVFQKSFNQVNKLEVSTLSRNIEMFDKTISENKRYHSMQLIAPSFLFVLLLTIIILEHYAG